MNFKFRPKLILALAAVATALSIPMASAELVHNHADKYANSDGYVWISIGTDAYKTITEKYTKDLDLIVSKEQKLVFNKASQKERLMSTPMALQVRASQLDKLSKIMHQEFHRCAGFIAHADFEGAKSATQLSNQTATTAVEYSIDNPAVVSELLSQLQPTNLTSTVTNMSNYNNRYYTAQSGVEASNWLKGEWELLASSRDDISVELFQHSGWAQPSVIATIEGSTLADEIVVIGGHLDSINGSSPANGRAPGADDNASGIAVVTETLNAIVASGFKPQRTIKLMGYAAEEVGLRGSDEIAAQFAQDNIDVVGAAQFDMTGFRGTTGQDFTFISDFTNAEQNQYMADLVDTYLTDLTYDFDLCGYGCSDHASWTRHGFAASFPFEANFRNSNSRIHTSGDSAFDSAHAINFAKLSVIYAAELAKGTTEISTALSSLLFSQAELDAENNSTITISVRRVGPNQSAVSVDFQTVDGSAIAGTDYQATSGTLNWDALDNAEKQISIVVNSVDVDKSFTVDLSNPQGGELGSTSTISVTVKAQAVTQPDPEPEAESSGGGGSLGYLSVILLLLIRNRKLGY